MAKYAGLGPNNIAIFFDDLSVVDDLKIEKYFEITGDIPTDRGIIKTDGVSTLYVEPYPTVDYTSIKTSKIQEIKASCEQAIHAGFDADVLSRGTLHYTLTDYQQDDLKLLMEKIKAGATQVLWHDDSRVTHEIYTAEQFTNLFSVGYTHIITCKIRSDFLEQYVNDLLSAGSGNQIEAINWETVLPDEYQTQVDTQISIMLGTS